MYQVNGLVGVANPLRACKPLENSALLEGRIVIVERGECMFVDKVSIEILSHSERVAVP